MKKRILSMALAVLLILSLTPFTASAANQTPAAPYKFTISNILRWDYDANGLFVDLDGDGVPELLVAQTMSGGGTGASFYAVRSGKPECLLDTTTLRGDLNLYSTRYQSIDVVSLGGKKQLMAMQSSHVLAGQDEVYGPIYRDQAEFWLFDYANGEVTQTDHWSYQFLELEDGRYFADESVVKHNGVLSTPEALDAMWSRLSIQTTVSCFSDSNGMPLTVLLHVAKGKFRDVPDGQYYSEPVDWAVAHGVTNGTSITTFSPDDPCTRGQVVTFLWRAAGSPEPTSADHPFRDIKPSDYFYKAVLWAVEQGITNGMDLTHFGPDVPCTRAHVVTFLWRAQDQPAAGTANPFVDVPAGAYYTDAVLWAVKEKITNGMDDKHFAPDSTCIRAQIVTFLYRALADRLPPAPPPVGDLRMACGGEAYTNTQLFGENIAYLISGHTMTYVEALSSDGSAANLATLQSGKAQLCLCRADAASYAYTGTRGDTGVAAYQDFSVLAAVNEDPIEIITLDDSIQTVDDLRGKTVAIGEKGSLLYYNALDILGAYGLTEADITPVYLPDADAVYAMKNGDLDTAFICRTADFWSGARLYDLYYSYVTMDEAHVAALLAEKPYYRPYPFAVENADGETTIYYTVSVCTLLLARNDVADSDVGNILSTICDRFTMQSIMDMTKIFREEGFAQSVTDIPYHPAAAAFYAEQGGGKTP